MDLDFASTCATVEVLSGSTPQIPELISHSSGLSFNIFLLFCALQKAKPKQTKKNRIFIFAIVEIF
ncbi:hypothetical protein GCM10027035_45820 [Emticicia sediminis]